MFLFSQVLRRGDIAALESLSTYISFELYYFYASVLGGIIAIEMLHPIIVYYVICMCLFQKEACLLRKS